MTDAPFFDPWPEPEPDADEHQRVRSGARRDLTSTEHLWHEHEPRIGVRLADGTRLGHRPPHSARAGALGPTATSP
jgi:hypothetical protein